MPIVAMATALAELTGQFVKLYQENKAAYSAETQAEVEAILTNAAAEYQAAFTDAQAALRG